MTTATIEEVQAHLPEMLVQLGGESIVIVSDGKPVGRLVPPLVSKEVPIYGRGKGKVLQLIDDDEHLQERAHRGSGRDHVFFLAWTFWDILRHLSEIPTPSETPHRHRFFYRCRILFHFVPSAENLNA